MLEQFAHGNCSVAHAVRETPFIIIPGEDAHEGAFQNLGLIHMEGGRMWIVVEVNRHVWLCGIAQNAL